MKTWQKIAIVAIGGAVSWVAAYCSSLYPAYALVLASASTASTATVGLLVGWTPKTT